MNKDIKTLIKLLKIRKRNDLANLFNDSRAEIRSSGQYGTRWYSILSEFVIFSPVEKYLKCKDLPENDKEFLLGLIREIYPVEDNAPEVTNLAFRILSADNSDFSRTIEETEIQQKPFSKSIRIFLSYSSDDGILAGKIKRYLEDYFGFEVFLAHEDIGAAEEWPKVIIENLKSTDIFMPLLSPNFTKSSFTDQETGMAFILGKGIIPISVETGVTPYGFINKIQALKLKIEDSSSYYE